MNRYQKPRPELYSEATRRELSLSFPRKDSNYVVLLFFLSCHMPVVQDVLDEAEVSWTQIGLDDPVCPPSRALEILGPLDDVTCLLLRARHGLVEEMLATLDYESDRDWSLLDRLAGELQARQVIFCMGFTLPSGSRIWTEPNLFPGGTFWEARECFVESHLPVQHLPNVGILARPRRVEPEGA